MYDYLLMEHKMVKWSGRMAKTLALNYYSTSGNPAKVQVRTWTKEHRNAMLFRGWDVYARPIGRLDKTRWQLIYCPIRTESGALPFFIEEDSDGKILRNYKSIR